MSAKHQDITSIDDLDSLLAASNDKPTFLFKHSTTCPISHNAAEQYQRFADGVEDGVLFGFLDLRAHRDVSDAIESRLGIRHESPQAILLKNGEPVWHASHQQIVASNLDAALAQNR